MKRNAWLAFLAIVLLTFGTVGTTLFAIWRDLGSEQVEILKTLLFRHAGILIIGGMILLVMIGFIVNLMYHWYVTPLQAIADDTRIICVSNPSHRLSVQGRSDLVDLVASINGIANRYQSLLEDMDARVREANAALEEERNTLAALVSNLTQGVLVCNPEGRILLYNQRARLLLEDSDWRNGGDWIGLGRSVYGVIDENRIAHALASLDHRLQQGKTGLMAPFVVARAGGQMLNVHVILVLDLDSRPLAHIFTLEDITRRMGTEHRFGRLWRSVTQEHRSAITSIRAAIETVLAFPDMDDVRRSEFLVAIRDEVLKMNGHLDGLEAEHGQDGSLQGSLGETLGSDLLAITERQVTESQGIAIEIAAPVEPVWLKVDSYAVVRLLLFVIDKLMQMCRAADFLLTLERGQGLASLTLEWSGAALHREALRSWGMLNVPMDRDGASATLFEVVERHDGAIWCDVSGASGRPCLRLVLPVAAETFETAALEEVGADHDFDFTLLHSKASAADVEMLPLERLSYTVFDTETTGLSPSAGDEIIAIGAVRIVNGRVLRREIFDCLVDPRRAISAEAFEIHRISSDMLRGMPTIHEVIPRFHRFVADTVIVGHNVAFDLRFLQLKEDRTGLRFDNPVLDTLLLASVVQPMREDQGLDALAARLGIEVTRRHSALGDALTTAQVLLALIPMLRARGIRTLKEAMAACEGTKYARIRY